MSLDKSLQDLFHEALEHEDPAARALFLDQACGADAALRERLDPRMRVRVVAVDECAVDVEQDGARLHGGPNVRGWRTLRASRRLDAP